MTYPTTVRVRAVMERTLFNLDFVQAHQAAEVRGRRRSS
jgi:hypothetical protein